MKKYGQISIVLNTNTEEKTCEKDIEQNIYDFSETVKTKKKSINTSENILLKNNDCINNEFDAIKKLRKKSKYIKSLNLIECSKNNYTRTKMFEKSDEEVGEQNIIDFHTKNNINPKTKSKVNVLAYHKISEEVSKQDINDSEYWKNLNRTLKSEFNTTLDISLENKSSINSDSVVTKKLKKKKKHNKSLNSIELNTKNDLEINSVEKTYKEDEPDINHSSFRENVSQKKNLSSDTSSKNNSSINNDNVVTKKLKKKKKHNKSLNSIELNPKNDLEIKSFEKPHEEDEEPNIINSLNNISKKRKYKINALADVDIVPTKKLKKKKNHDVSLNTNHDTEDIIFEEVGKQNINDSETTKCSIDDENVQTKGPKKKKKHNKSLNSLELNTINDSKINTINGTNLKSDESILNSGTNISMSNSKTFKVHNVCTPNIVEATDNNCSMSKNENIIPVISENFSSTDLKTSQNHFKLKTLLNSMESNDFEGSSTKIETKFNLIKYLKNKEASLQNHPKFKQIMEMLSKKIKNIVNKNCQITNSDIVLLKTVGNIILEKIVEKMNAAQDINDIKITLPPECKENKIHFIETTLGRPPSKVKMDIIKKLNPQVKLRVFNLEEDNIIREYWSKFQKEYKISNILPFLSNGLEMALDKTQRLQFVRYISAGLPNRLLSSVFIRFNILFNGHQDKTRFSEEEDQLIMKVEKCDIIKRKLSVLSLILNRSRMQLYRRHGVLKNQFEKCKKVCWDDQKRQELFTNILLETNTDNWKDLKNLTLKKNTLIKIAENLGEDVTFEKVRKQWNYLYTMLFCEKPIKMLTLRLKILELLEQQNFKHFSDVNWIKITNQLYPGANSKLICDFFHGWIDKNVPSNLKKNIKDTLNYLREHNVDKIRKEIHKHGEREFPRLTVQDYDLLVVIDE